MGTLVLLRHGKSDWSGGEPDHLRPLARRGRRQVPEAGRWLADNVGVIDLAIVSPAERARETWRLAAAELDVPPPVREDARVYAASPRTLLGVLREVPPHAATVVLVGHNPGLEDLAESLTGRLVPMPTSALAVIDLPGPWSEAGHTTGALTAQGRPPGQLVSPGRSA
jgi:phosphohistidine phosphatase